MYEKFIPKFAVVELNNSTAHKIGHAISQVPAYVKTDEGQTRKIIASKKVNDMYFVENGVIVGLGADGLLSNYDKQVHSRPCLVYDDELITGNFTSLNRYAVPAEEDKPVYVRALPLYLGDTFTTNNFSGVPADGVAGVKNGILTFGEQGDFIAKVTTMPNGEVGVEFTYIGA